MGTMSRVTHDSGKTLNNIHSSGSPNSLENGQKVGIGRRKNDAGNEKRKTINMTQRSFAKTGAY